MRLQAPVAGEVGVDEVGRGCLAGPVVAAAVLLPESFYHPDIQDSKRLSQETREELSALIQREALSYAVGALSAVEIDTYNILQASIKAMHLALEGLSCLPQLIRVDGKYFHPYKNRVHQCVVKGDSLYISIAAASIVAKVYRDDLMRRLHRQYPDYGWHQNKGYPTKAHRAAIALKGITPEHRKSFKLLLAE